MADHRTLLKDRMSEDSNRKLVALQNPKVEEFVAEFVELCSPDSVFVADDSEEDRTYVRRKAIENGEERELATSGHT
ncbi:MAG: phosphoenolpyruvate carboxykinase (GTP), partial [Planctomycetota bacterium]